ncbi:hypothetical protein IJJ05_00965 [Candidatus Saccharibacteria bacterium]|nr:hypothetical protein [Candidatus Saccharibacteria bacterium]
MKRKTKTKGFEWFFVGLFSIMMIAGLALNNLASADSVVDLINITVPVSCSLSGTGMASHNATISNGTYQNNIGSTTLKAFCNDTNGFAIYAAGYTNDTIGEENSNKLVGTNASMSAIITGLATAPGNPDTSNWAMKLTATGDSGDTSGTNALTIDSAPNTAGGADASFNNYHTVPNEFTKVAHKNAATSMDETTGGATLTTTYAAYISKTQAAGAYQGQVIYALVHPASSDAPVVCNSNATTISEVKCMQDFASVTSTNRTAILNSMTTGTQYTIKDKRDGKEYTIAKLADGKVWMTQNLDLDLDSSITYTNLDTDLGWNTTTNSYDTAAWSPARSTYATATNNIHEWCNGGTWNSQYGYCEINNTPESYDPGNLYWNSTESDYSDWDAYYSSCDYSTSTPACNESLNPLSTYTSSTGTAQYHLGNYYNWPAAIASNDASIYGTYNETTDEYENLEANQSICPAGWTLPYTTYNENTNQPEGDFVNLWTAYGWTYNDGFSDISTLWSAPLYSAPTGNFNGNLGDVGDDGDFWSSVATDDYNARFAYFGVGGGASPAGDDSRDYGDSVRCLLR